MEKPINELPRVCGILNKHKVDYLLIGGLAVSFHGFTRATADIDFWYKPDNENYFKLLKAISDLGEDISELQEHVFDPGKTFVRFKSGGIKVEFLSAFPAISIIGKQKNHPLKPMLKESA